MNRVHAGSLGGVADVNYSLEEMIQWAKKSSSLKDFRKKYPAAYSYCARHGWRDAIQNILHPEKEKWTEQKMLKQCKDFKTRYELRKNMPNLYQAVCLKKIQNKAFSHMPDFQNKCNQPKSIEDVKNLASIYKTRSEFRRKNLSLYYYAQNRGWLDEVCKEMKPIDPHRRYFWTDEMINEKAQECNSRSEFKRKYPYAYRLVCKDKKIDNICAHMKSKSELVRQARVCTKESIISIAQKCNNWKEFYTQFASYYHRAIKIGIIDDIRKIINR